MKLGNNYYVNKICVDIIGGERIGFSEKDGDYYVEIKERVLKICDVKNPVENIGGVLYDKTTYIPLCCIERIETYERELTYEEKYGDVE